MGFKSLEATSPAMGIWRNRKTVTYAFVASEAVKFLWFTVFFLCSQLNADGYYSLNRLLKAAKASPQI